MLFVVVCGLLLLVWLVDVRCYSFVVCCLLVVALLFCCVVVRCMLSGVCRCTLSVVSCVLLGSCYCMLFVVIVCGLLALAVACLLFACC